MPTLLLSPRYSDDSIALWRAAGALGWGTQRLQGWRLESRLEGEVVVYGEPLFAATVAQQLDLVLLEAPFDWLARVPRDLVRRDVQFAHFRDVRALAFPRFVKPADDKSFPAAVYRSHMDIPGYIDMPGSVPILSSDPVTWLHEFRAFISDGELRALSLYLRAGELDIDGSEDELGAARAFLQGILPKLDLPPATVLDFGEISGTGWAIVEANPCWGAGLCSCEPAAVLEVLRRACIPKAQLSSADSRWVARREEPEW